MDQSKLSQMLRVAKMYYELHLGQQEISDQEKISKSTVSRLLAAAMDSGYIEVKVRQPEHACSDLEERFLATFPLRHVVIVPDLIGSAEVILNEVCQAMADDLARFIEDNSILGVAWGRTLSVLSGHLPQIPREGVTTIQLNGGSSRAMNQSGSYEVVRAFKDATGGEGFLLPAPAIVDTPEIATSIAGDSQLASVLQLAENCKTAVFSVGRIAMDSVLYELGCFTPLEYQGIESAGAVGDICSHYIDMEGNIVDEKLDRRVVGTPLSVIKKIENKLVVATGRDKAKPLLGALRGGYVDGLYIDNKLAESVLELAGL